MGKGGKVMDTVSSKHPTYIKSSSYFMNKINSSEIKFDELVGCIAVHSFRILTKARENGGKLLVKKLSLPERIFKRRFDAFKKKKNQPQKLKRGWLEKYFGDVGLAGQCGSNICSKFSSTKKKNNELKI